MRGGRSQPEAKPYPLMKSIPPLTTVICSALLLLGCAKEKTIGLKQNIQHDDFEYSVQMVAKTRQIGDKKAHGEFYLVTFQVENRAKRVGHRWSNDIAYCTDENGTLYEDHEEVQQELNRLQPFGYRDHYLTPAGQVESTILVYDLPAGIKEPCLKVRGEFLMGDLFDGCQYRKIRVKLF
jgi:hypothetical protein